MADSPRSILLLAAIHDEIAPALRRIKGDIATGRVIPCVTGMGRDNVLKGLDTAIEAHQPRHVLHVGVAGGLRPGFDGAAIVHRAIRSEDETITIGDPTGCTVLTSDTPAVTKTDKRRLFEQYGADLIDMETYYVAQHLAERNIELTAIRAVCDTAEESILSDALGWVDDEGRPNVWAAMNYLAIHPWHLPIVVRMARRMHSATRNLALAIVDQVSQ